jgi:LPS O-antigen subunit length determinant protein (WzzB/FepE family)
MYYKYLKQIRKELDKEAGVKTKTTPKSSGGVMSYRQQQQPSTPEKSNNPQQFMIDYFKMLRELKENK